MALFSLEFGESLPFELFHKIIEIRSNSRPLPENSLKQSAPPIKYPPYRHTSESRWDTRGFGTKDSSGAL